MFAALHGGTKTGRIAKPVAAFMLATWLLLTPHASSATVEAPQAHAPQSTLVVNEQDAENHFPESVLFTLKSEGFSAKRATLNYRLAGDDVTIGISVDFPQAASSISTDATIDLRIDYIPPGTDVSYFWRLTSPDGSTADTPTKTIHVDDEGYDWQTLDDASNRLTVHWYNGDQSFGQRALDTASQALDSLETEVGTGLKKHIEVWIYANGDDLFDALPLHEPDWVGGQAYPAQAVMLTGIADDTIAGQAMKRILPHELSHIALYQASRNPYNVPPTWLDEGLAIHAQQVSSPEVDAALQPAAESGGLFPLKTLSGAFGVDEDVTTLSYAESKSVVDFILSDPRYGPAKLAKTLAAFQNGVTYDEALQAGLGIGTAELDKEWRASLPYKQPAESIEQAADAASNGLPVWAGRASLAAMGVFAILAVIALLVSARRVIARRK